MANLILLSVLVVTIATSVVSRHNKKKSTTLDYKIEYDDNHSTSTEYKIEYDMNVQHRSNNFEMTNPDIVSAGELYQKDMLLTPEQRLALKERKATTKYNLWTASSAGYPIVPYSFKDSQVNQAAVINGIKHWEDHTCIRFQETSDLSKQHLSFIYGGGCYSNVGRTDIIDQPISIGNNCDQLGTIAHEIGHAMGFHHEQSRSDRDSYVRIYTANIVEGKENNFNKEATNNHGIDYDYTSNMHYGPTYFSANGLDTIGTIDPLYQNLIGSRNGLTHNDKLMANKMYKCIDYWLGQCSLTADPCQNNGYTGSSCDCVCPPGTSGTNCETITGGYYDQILASTGSEKITVEKTITSKGYPGAMTAYDDYTKVIKAPVCKLPKLTFKAFHLYDKTDDICKYDILEIKTTDLTKGDEYCATMISVGQSFNSTTRDMILSMQTRSPYPGFSADLTFIDDPSCSTATTKTPTTTTTNKPQTTTTTNKPQTTTTTNKPQTTTTANKAQTTTTTNKAQTTTTTNIPQTTTTTNIPQTTTTTNIPQTTTTTNIPQTTTTANKAQTTTTNIPQTTTTTNIPATTTTNKAPTTTTTNIPATTTTTNKPQTTTTANKALTTTTSSSTTKAPTTTTTITTTTTSQTPTSTTTKKAVVYKWKYKYLLLRGIFTRVWTIKAPVGQRVKIVIVRLRFPKRSWGCRFNYLMLNPSGNPVFTSKSITYCRKKKVTNTFYSHDNVFTLKFRSYNFLYYALIKYTAVA